MSKIRKAWVVGDPIVHSLSPVLHQAWLEQTGINGVYKKAQISSNYLPKKLKTLFRKDGFVGVNITLPHKSAVLQIADKITRRAEQAGAANLLYKKDNKIIADNTDIIGFITPLLKQKTSQQLTQSSVLIFGAGGAARAVIIALQNVGVQQITLCNRSNERARKVLEEFAQKTSVTSFQTLAWKNRNKPEKQIDLVVNASSAGMTGIEPLDVNLGFCSKETLIYDLVYRPLLTPFLLQAKGKNLNYIDGLEMLVSQAMPCFKVFFGTDPPTDSFARKRLESCLIKRNN
jgi:shikimate dehydrogenase